MSVRKTVGSLTGNFAANNDPLSNRVAKGSGGSSCVYCAAFDPYLTLFLCYRFFFMTNFKLESF